MQQLNLVTDYSCSLSHCSHWPCSLTNPQSGIYSKLRILTADTRREGVVSLNGLLVAFKRLSNHFKNLDMSWNEHIYMKRATEMLAVINFQTENLTQHTVKTTTWVSLRSPKFQTLHLLKCWSIRFRCIGPIHTCLHIAQYSYKEQ